MQVDRTEDPPHPVEVRIGEAIRAARTAAGLSQTALADLIELIEQRGDARSQPGISDWEYGKKAPGVAELTFVERALGLPLGWILTTAGYVTATDVEKAIAADCRLDDDARQNLLDAYRTAVRQSRRSARPRSASARRRT